MCNDMRHKGINISPRRDASDLQRLFDESAVDAMLRFLDHTSVGKRKEEEEAKGMDDWDIERLDRSDEGDEEMVQEDCR